MFAGKPRSEDQMDRKGLEEWRVSVLKEQGNTCAITGEQSDNVVVHHLYGKTCFSSLRYDPSNAIVLNACVHNAIHYLIGTRDTPTLYHLILLLHYMDVDLVLREKIINPPATSPKSKKKAANLDTPISSQAPKEFGEGSETRVYDPERVMKLQERMAKLNPILIARMSQEEKDQLNLLIKKGIKFKNYSV
jgi:hypothetical protein